MLFQVLLRKNEENFRLDALFSLIELCNQIKVRFPLFSSNVFTLLEIIDPNVATLQLEREINNPNAFKICISY